MLFNTVGLEKQILAWACLVVVRYDKAAMVLQWFKFITLFLIPTVVFAAPPPKPPEKSACEAALLGILSPAQRQQSREAAYQGLVGLFNHLGERSDPSSFLELQNLYLAAPILWVQYFDPFQEAVVSEDLKPPLLQKMLEIERRLHPNQENVAVILSWAIDELKKANFGIETEKIERLLFVICKLNGFSLLKNTAVPRKIFNMLFSPDFQARYTLQPNLWPLVVKTLKSVTDDVLAGEIRKKSRSPQCTTTQKILAYEILGSRRDEGVLSQLISLVKTLGHTAGGLRSENNADTQNHILAVQALANLVDPRAVETLKILIEDHYHDTDPQIASICAHGLVQIAYFKGSKTALAAILLLPRDLIFSWLNELYTTQSDLMDQGFASDLSDLIGTDPDRAARAFELLEFLYMIPNAAKFDVSMAELALAMKQRAAERFQRQALSAVQKKKGLIEEGIFIAVLLGEYKLGTKLHALRLLRELFTRTGARASADMLEALKLVQNSLAQFPTSIVNRTKELDTFLKEQSGR